MNSKIRIEFDFETKQPYLQLIVETDNRYAKSEPDMRDQMLKHFVEMVNEQGVELTYDQHGNPKLIIQRPFLNEVTTSDYSHVYNPINSTSSPFVISNTTENIIGQNYPYTTHNPENSIS